MRWRYDIEMLEWLGLGGDGDEVDAIERVEQHFGIFFDVDDCERFVTVGDVWRALLKELKLSAEDGAQHWPSFVRILGADTLRGDQFEKVCVETKLIGGPTIREWLANLFKGRGRG